MMEFLAVSGRFRQILGSLRERLPVHDEFPLLIQEQEASTFLASIPVAGSWEFKQFIARRNPRDMALFCRALTLPDAVLCRKRWEPLLELYMGIKLYLLLRSMLQFHPENDLLLEIFRLTTGRLVEGSLKQKRILTLMKSNRDDLFSLPPDEKPVMRLLQVLLNAHAMLGVYAADQCLTRNAPLFDMLRDLYFQHCSVLGFTLDRRELMQCLSKAEPESVRRILGHFLSLFEFETFPEGTTQDLIRQFGDPDESAVWEEADLVRLETKSGNTVGLMDLILWFRQEKMKAHFGEGTLKMAVFSRFIRHIQKITFHETHHAMQMHFVDFTVVDFQSVQLFSWVCDPAELELRWSDMVRIMLDQGGEGMPVRRRKVPEARDYVIVQENGAAIRLAFIETGLLYASDLLSIRLGLMERAEWGVM